MIDLDKVIFISDDLTGAGDLATMLASFSRDVYVYSTPRETKKNWVIYDTETRNVSKEESKRKLSRFRTLTEKKAIIKKIDSTLRGNIKSECELFCQWYPELTVYFIPAFPQMDRKTIDGVHLVDGNDVTDSVYAIGSINPPISKNLVDYCPDNKEAIVMEAGEFLTADPKEFEGRFICMDCRDEKELDEIGGKISANLKSHKRTMLLCASAISKYMDFRPEKNTFEKKKIIRLQTLFFCGSLNPINRKLAKQFCMEEIIVDEDLILGFEEYINNLRMHINRHLIFGRNVAVFYSGQKVLHGRSDLLDDRLGKLFSQVYSLAPRVIISGGNTAVACLKNIDLYYYKLDNILGTGIASLSSNNTSFIIKPGGFGDATLFSTIMEEQCKEV